MVIDKKEFTKIKRKVVKKYPKAKTMVGTNGLFYVHDGDKVVQMFHIIVEDLEGGQCNGEYSLISETELLDKYNLTFNN